MNNELIEKVIADILTPWDSYEGTEEKWDRYMALDELKTWIDMEGPYEFAKQWGVLVNNSAEEFMMQFMNTFNREVRWTY
jgi:hypothetical protein